MEGACEALTIAVAQVLDVPAWNNEHVLPCTTQLVKAVKHLVTTSKQLHPSSSDLQEALGAATKTFVEETRFLLKEKKLVPHSKLLKSVNDITRINDALLAASVENAEPEDFVAPEKTYLICHFCGLNINKRHVTLYEKTFHLKCFRCKCGSECDPKSRLFAGPEGFPICSACTPRCSGCQESVTGSHIVPVAGKQYHPQCLACEVCLKKMPIEDLGLTNNVICCESCSMDACKQEEVSEVDTLLNTMRFSDYGSKFKEAGVSKLSELAEWQNSDYDAVGIIPSHRELIISVLKLIQEKISEQPQPQTKTAAIPLNRVASALPPPPVRRSSHNKTSLEANENSVESDLNNSNNSNNNNSNSNNSNENDSTAKKSATRQRVSPKRKSSSSDNSFIATVQPPKNVSFDHLLRNEKGIETWVQYACEMKSPESIFFWLEVEVFRSYIGPPAAVAEYAANISAKYLVPEAEYCVQCIPLAIKNQLFKELEQATPLVFDDVQKIVFLDMEKQSWPKFVGSEKGIKICNYLNATLPRQY